jgi:hypothetical protein
MNLIQNDIWVIDDGRLYKKKKKKHGLSPESFQLALNYV